MNNDVDILLVEDDDGHANLVIRNLKRVGLDNEIRLFKNGKEILDFLSGTEINDAQSYLILLDIRMPKVNGIEVLKEIKDDKQWAKIPVIMLTTTDDPEEISTCHQLGCNNYIVKPVDYEKFIDAIKSLGLFLKVVEMPTLKGGGS